MSAYGTDQSKLYQLRGGAETEHRDRSMEQSNSNSGNPYGYIPPTFNPITSTWNIPTNWSTPTPQGVNMPTGPGQIPMPAFPQMTPLAPHGVGGQTPTPPPSPQPLPVDPASFLYKNGAPGPSTPPPSQGTPQPPSYMPQFNDGSTSSDLAKHFMPSLGNSDPLMQRVGGGYLTPGQTSYNPSPYAVEQPQPSPVTVMDNSALAQQLRHLKTTFGYGPAMKAGKSKGGGGLTQ